VLLLPLLATSHAWQQRLSLQPCHSWVKADLATKPHQVLLLLSSLSSSLCFSPSSLCSLSAASLTLSTQPSLSGASRPSHQAAPGAAAVLTIFFSAFLSPSALPHSLPPRSLCPRPSFHSQALANLATKSHQVLVLTILLCFSPLLGFAPSVTLPCHSQALADLATKSHQVLLLPLLATSHAWQQRLSLQPHAAPLAAMLVSLLGKLQGHWGSFCAGQVAAVEQYDSRSKMGLQQGEAAVCCCMPRRVCSACVSLVVLVTVLLHLWSSMTAEARRACNRVSATG
jgi:hypothetical protein